MLGQSTGLGKKVSPGGSRRRSVFSELSPYLWLIHVLCFFEHLLSIDLCSQGINKEQNSYTVASYAPPLPRSFAGGWILRLALENTSSVVLSSWCFPGDGSYCQPDASRCPVSGVGSHGAEACEFPEARGDVPVSLQNEKQDSGLGYKCLLCMLSQT